MARFDVVHPGDVTEKELYASASLVVRFVGRGCSPVCVITFESFADLPGLTRPGFGAAYFRARGVDAVHVVCRDNRWYQYEDLPEALAAIERQTRVYPLRLTYGSSMGGYAAIRFGGALKADCAVALSPQYSIDPRKVPFDRRWRGHARAIRFLHDDPSAALPPVGRAVVVYDPHDSDRHHVDLIAREISVQRVRLRHGGHPSGSYLAEAGLLDGLLKTVAAGTFDASAIERAARQARRRSGQYLFTLGWRLPVRKLRWKIDLARMAVAAWPDDPAYIGYLALVTAEAGLMEEAERHHRDAAGRTSETPLFKYRRALFLMARGDPRAAVRILDELPVSAAGRSRELRVRFIARLAAGHPKGALTVLASLGRSDPGALVLVPWLAFRVALWRWGRGVLPASWTELPETRVSIAAREGDVAWSVKTEG